ncbi:MAG: hypothetical protein Q8K89_06875 [Actinomycetota bacterium]|nr:hypothetical protein [Actinomycetota bacterium]
MSETTKKLRNKLVASAVLFVMLTLAAYLTSTPQRSAASTWITWAWQLGYRAFPVHDKAELTELHKNASQAPREQCVACHGDKTGSKLPLHRIHLRSALLPHLACPECHRRVDLTPRDNVVVVTWVDVGFCKKCHSAFQGLEPGSRMRPEDFEADCTMCHTGDHAIKHAQPYLSQVMPSSECRGCHGGRVLPWTPLHERDDWLQTHGAEALRAGVESCFHCHDFGLKFCDGCHATKPPSHLPAEQWRALHPSAAAADTRVCYTCHETSFCKRCHVNHEAGWMNTHPAFVNEYTSSSCTECHSLSSCSFCHIALSKESAESSPTQ